MVTPDVVLMDMQLADATGVQAATEVLAVSPSSRVLVLSASDERDDVLDAVKAGGDRIPGQERVEGRPVRSRAGHRGRARGLHPEPGRAGPGRVPAHRAQHRRRGPVLLALAIVVAVAGRNDVVARCAAAGFGIFGSGLFFSYAPLDALLTATVVPTHIAVSVLISLCSSRHSWW